MLFISLTILLWILIILLSILYFFNQLKNFSFLVSSVKFIRYLPYLNFTFSLKLFMNSLKAFSDTNSSRSAYSPVTNSKISAVSALI